MSEVNEVTEVERLRVALAAALRVVEAARVYLSSPDVMLGIFTYASYSKLRAAVREWEAAQPKEKRG